MDINQSHDNIVYNGINPHQDKEQNANEENDNNEMILDHNVFPNEVTHNDPMPQRNRRPPVHFRGTQPIVEIRQKKKKRNRVIPDVIPDVPVVDNVQRRAKLMLAVHNYVMKINADHQINVNSNEEIIDIEIRPREDVVNEIHQNDINQPYVANPLRRMHRNDN